MPIIEKIKEKVMPQQGNAAAQQPATTSSAGSSTNMHMLMPGDRQHSNNLDDSQHHDSKTTGVTHGFAGRLKDAATGNHFSDCLSCATCVAMIMIDCVLRCACILWHCL
jgi:hypothetical protein